MSGADQPLQVGLNLLWCAPGRVGGSEEYLTRLLHGVTALTDREMATPDLGAATDISERQISGVEITVYASSDFVLAHRELAERFTVCSPRWPVGSQAVRIMTEHTWLAAQSRGHDLIHHAGGTAPVIGPRPQVVTIHDLQYLRYPQYFSRARLSYLRQMIPRSVARAAMVLVPSEYVRLRVMEAFGLPSERVQVVPHGIAAPAQDVADPAELRIRYHLGDGPVYVYPAITHPHKNHALLLTAMARHWTDPDLRVVLLGGRGAADAEVTQMIVDLGLSQRVIRPGRVPDADRDGLIALADALVFPSRYEGFGAPLIEAMALGTPVAACNLTAVTEVVGEAGWLLPDDPEGWADLPAKIASEGAMKATQGQIRSAEFSLESSASALLSAYRTAHHFAVSGGTAK